VQKFATAAGLVASLRQCNSEFAEFLAVHEQTPALEGLNLMSFLVLPVQQLPRYGSVLLRLRVVLPRTRIMFSSAQIMP
jgi:hypothetical protein